jgi:hypothetical protein
MSRPLPPLTIEQDAALALHVANGWAYVGRNPWNGWPVLTPPSDLRRAAPVFVMPGGTLTPTTQRSVEHARRGTADRLDTQDDRGCGRHPTPSAAA